MQAKPDLVSKIQDMASKFWNSLPPHFKLFNLFIISASLFAIVSGSLAMAISPAKLFGAWPPKLWTLVSYGLMDMYILPLILHLVMINYALQELRQIWQPVNFFIFIALASIITGALYCLIILLIYSFTAGYLFTSLYTKPFVTLQTTTLFLLMALRQHFSDRQYNTRIPVGTGTLKITYQNLVHAQILITLIEIVLFQLSFAYFFISLCSYYSSWLCLRFIVKHQLSRSKGDPSSQFALAEVLPYPVKPYAENICNQAFALGVNSGILRDFNRRCQSGVLGESNEIERKRALERLNAEVEKIVQSEQQKSPVTKEVDEEAKPLKTEDDEEEEFGQFESVELEEPEEGAK